MASILIHLDFLSIYNSTHKWRNESNCFNPYSPGFSIYLKEFEDEIENQIKLQSLFTWIFYLFSLFARYLDS